MNEKQLPELKKLSKETPRRNQSTRDDVVKKEMTPEQIKNFREYQRKFIDVTYRQYSIRFRSDRDADIIAYIDDSNNIPNLTNYIRRKILEDLYKGDPREKDINGRPIEVVEEGDKEADRNSLATKALIGKGL